MAMRFTLRQLEYLIAVGECGSIALAAERVNVTSPSISTSISQLEAEFGLQLFVRKHAHGLSLTQGGKQFVEQARRVMTEAAQLNDLANSITGKVRGPLNVGCLLTFAQIVLPQLRYGFVERYPEVTFRQFERNQTELIDGIRNATLDVALTYDLNIPPDLNFVPLVSLPPYAVFGEAHDFSDRESVSVSELADYPMVLLDLPLSAEYFLSFFTTLGFRPNIVERTRDMAVMHALVANSIGYSIANIRPFSDRAPDGGVLRFVPLTGSVRPMQLGVLMAEGAKSSLTIATFSKFCGEKVTEASIVGQRSRP